MLVFKVLALPSDGQGVLEAVVAVPVLAPITLRWGLNDGIGGFVVIHGAIP
jgi:hypothetical protein